MGSVPCFATDFLCNLGKVAFVSLCPNSSLYSGDLPPKEDKYIKACEALRYYGNECHVKQVSVDASVRFLPACKLRKGLHLLGTALHWGQGKSIQCHSPYRGGVTMLAGVVEGQDIALPSSHPCWPPLDWLALPSSISPTHSSFTRQHLPLLGRVLCLSPWPLCTACRDTMHSGPVQGPQMVAQND